MTRRKFKILKYIKLRVFTSFRYLEERCKDFIIIFGRGFQLKILNGGGDMIYLFPHLCSLPLVLLLALSRSLAPATDKTLGCFSLGVPGERGRPGGGFTSLKKGKKVKYLSS